MPFVSQSSVTICSQTNISKNGKTCKTQTIRSSLSSTSKGKKQWKNSSNFIINLFTQFTLFMLNGNKHIRCLRLRDYDFGCSFSSFHIH